jgi:hypothetical protein
MTPQSTQVHLLALAEVVSILLAYRHTPARVRHVLLNFTRELKTLLPAESLNDIESAEAKAIIRAVAYDDSGD